MQLYGSLNILWHCPFSGLKWKLTFSSPVVTAEFSKFADILSAALSQHHLLGIPSPPLALFIVMLPKVHLTLHSRMTGSRWVTTPSWLSGWLRPFLYSFSVYSHHLFWISLLPWGPGPRIKPTSLALSGRFLTTRPPGKSPKIIFKNYILRKIVATHIINIGRISSIY